MKTLLTLLCLAAATQVWSQDIISAMNGNYLIQSEDHAKANLIEIEDFSLQLSRVSENTFKQGMTEEDLQNQETRWMYFSFDIRDGRPEEVYRDIENQFSNSVFVYFDKYGNTIGTGNVPFGSRLKLGSTVTTDQMRIDRSISAYDISVYFVFEQKNELSGKIEVHTLKVQ